MFIYYLFVCLLCFVLGFFFWGGGFLTDRRSVVEGKSVRIRVDEGGGGERKKK